MWGIQQELFQAVFLVASTDPPDGGPITFQAGGDSLDRFASGDCQHDPSTLNLEPGEAAAVGYSFQNGSIGAEDGQPAGFATTHKPPWGSERRAAFSIQLPRICCMIYVEDH